MTTEHKLEKAILMLKRVKRQLGNLTPKGEQCLATEIYDLLNQLNKPKT